MTLMLRPATLADIPAIQEIYAESVLNGVATYELVPPDRAEMEARFRTITGLGYPYIVGEEDGKIAGYAYASAFRTRAAYRFLVEDSIYIAPQFRGRGLGRMLLDRLVADCTALGFRQMVAVIGGAHPASIGSAPRGRVSKHRQDAGDGLEIRPLARYGTDAAGAGRRRERRPSRG